MIAKTQRPRLDLLVKVLIACAFLLALLIPVLAHAQDVGDGGASVSATTPTTTAAPLVPAIPVVTPGAVPAPAPVVTNPDGGVAFFRSVLDAATSKNYFMLVTFALGVAVWVLRKPWLLGRVPFFTTKNGGRTLLLLTSVLGAVGTALIGYGSFKAINWGLLVVAVAHAAGAALPYDWIRSALGISSAAPDPGGLKS